MSIESSPSRFIAFPVAVYTGARTQYPQEFQQVIYPHEQENPRYNPDPDVLLDEMIATVFSANQPQRSLGEPPRKADTLAFNANFSDAHSFPLNIAREVDQDGAGKLVDEIRARAENCGPQTIPEQFATSLDVFDGNITRSALHLSVVTRHMARGQDFRLFEQSVNARDIVLWQQSVAGFSYLEAAPNDPAGDTYHFWVGYITGLSREAHSRDAYGKVTGQINDLIADNVARATTLLRYKLAGKPGIEHGTIDTLGYHLGRATWGLIAD